MIQPVEGGLDFQDAALAAASAWFALIDDCKYGESWEKAASLLRSGISRNRWVDAARSTRSRFGKIRSRSFLGAAYEAELPGAPDGHYVVFRYRAAFEHKERAVETVTPTLEQDGIWRVSGYIIQ